MVTEGETEIGTTTEEGIERIQGDHAIEKGPVPQVITDLTEEDEKK